MSTMLSHCRLILFFSVLICLVIVIASTCVSCDNSAQAFTSSYHYSNIYVSDTMLYKDHSYIIIRDNLTKNFSVLHSPDCFCRFNRKFIIVKHLN